jgi:hypothetical protein
MTNCLHTVASTVHQMHGIASRATPPGDETRRCGHTTAARPHANRQQENWSLQIGNLRQGLSPIPSLDDVPTHVGSSIGSGYRIWRSDVNRMHALGDTLPPSFAHSELISTSCVYITSCTLRYYMYVCELCKDVLNRKYQTTRGRAREPGFVTRGRVTRLNPRHRYCTVCMCV